MAGESTGEAELCGSRISRSRRIRDLTPWWDYSSFRIGAGRGYADHMAGYS